MATPEEIAELRNRTDEPSDSSSYSDEQLSALIDELESLDLATGVVWKWKAAKFASLVNVTESGSSRALSDLMAHALEMARQSDGSADVPPYSRPSVTRAIERL